MNLRPAKRLRPLRVIVRGKDVAMLRKLADRGKWTKAATISIALDLMAKRERMI